MAESAEMGRLLDALRTDSETAKPANPANPANLRTVGQEDSQIRKIRSESDSENQAVTDLRIAPTPPSEPAPCQVIKRGAAEAVRAHLLTLAKAEGLPPAIVHALHADDVAACAPCDDETLRAYLRALDRGHVMDAGIAPVGYTEPVHCAGCGPVLLWPGCPSQVKACPWCFRRRAGKSVPRPVNESADIARVRARE
jgi:hypothetical protein